MRTFESVEGVWRWYSEQPRALTPERISRIPWHLLDEHPIDAFVPALEYMRDIEGYTPDLYHPDLVGTPSGRDPILSQFLRRWSHEESTHAKLLDRVLDGRSTHPYQVPTPSRMYLIREKAFRVFENMMGEHFKALHMTWGSINELSTRAGYRAILQGTQNETLRSVLRGIIEEESRHYAFYCATAHIYLSSSNMSQMIVRGLIDWLWKPVGGDVAERARARPALELIDVRAFQDLISVPTQLLPGMEKLSITETFRRFTESAPA